MYGDLYSSLTFTGSYEAAVRAARARELQMRRQAPDADAAEDAMRCTEAPAPGFLARIGSWLHLPLLRHT
ncbi:hypothetical protein [Defluviimonas sp. WL0075]|uniref:Uncharacterized protein n=1 Tax=Albidovulum sediminicola TaxID=2984331 RepID=A0ABT2YY39_9RHOB|nr:hypothetical protein [Defluviimonas sp. WL0075]MCV2863784.1 hypothetical protein [Defluviimonas sp. WL0075]